jgi:recombinational DNA repair protein RecR
MMSQPRKECSRCGIIRDDGVDSDICGNCADDLRDEQSALWVEASPQQGL